MNINQICVLAPFLILLFIVCYSEVMLIYTFRNSTAIELLQVAVNQLLLAIAVYCGIKTAITDPGSPKQDLEQETLKDKRICRFCLIQKPTRAHHCRQCNKCRLRMDHHCPWINNCIGQNNYQLFFCLVMYSTLASLTYSVIYLIKLLNVDEFGNIEVYFMVFAMTMSLTMNILLVLFLGFHIKLVCSNQTTLEFLEKKRGNYSMGLFRNCQEMLSPGWCIPI